MPSKPQIVVENWEGANNSPEHYQKFKQMGQYRDLSTIWITPTRGVIPAKVVLNWMSLMMPPNQPVVKSFAIQQEVGHAYNRCLIDVLSNPALAKFKYVLTVEEDNTPPMDGLLKLYESIQEYDVVGGLYWTKGEGGSPMIWGDPKSPNTFVPQVPLPDCIQRCNGLGMGFTLFRMEMFRDARFTFGEWFKTVCGKEGMMTQDLYFFQKAAELGYKFACDTRVRVGHYDLENDVVW